jgi:hypothetical protein
MRLGEHSIGGKHVTGTYDTCGILDAGSQAARDEKLSQPDLPV